MAVHWNMPYPSQLAQGSFSFSPDSCQLCGRSLLDGHRCYYGDPPPNMLMGHPPHRARVPDYAPGATVEPEECPCLHCDENGCRCCRISGKRPRQVAACDPFALSSDEPL